jgi:L-threonylcarbamoyladenylate synthase
VKTKVKTKILEPTKKNIQEAARMIAEGKLVAFPTETVYGLGANALDADAVGRVYEAKGRPSDNPMIVHISRASDIGQMTRYLNPDIVALIENFWPGPLTMVVNKKPEIPDRTTGGLSTVAVRMPDSDIALDLINYADVPIAAPSANISGSPSPTKAEHVISDLDGRVDAIIKGPDCRVGIESTVIDMTGDVPTILRPGIITKEQIEAGIGKEVAYDPSLTEIPDIDEASGDPVTGEDFAPKSPGMKYRHYAPKADMIVIEGERNNVEREVARLKELNEKLGNKVGIILFEERDFIEAAHNFFAELRDKDKEGCDIIIAGALADTDGVGFAVMNRMLKSAGYNIARV